MLAAQRRTKPEAKADDLHAQSSTARVTAIFEEANKTLLATNAVITAMELNKMIRNLKAKLNAKPDPIEQYSHDLLSTANEYKNSRRSISQLIAEGLVLCKAGNLEMALKKLAEIREIIDKQLKVAANKLDTAPRYPLAEDFDGISNYINTHEKPINTFWAKTWDEATVTFGELKEQVEQSPKYSATKTARRIVATNFSSFHDEDKSELFELLKAIKTLREKSIEQSKQRDRERQKQLEQLRNQIRSNVNSLFSQVADEASYSNTVTIELDESDLIDKNGPRKVEVTISSKELAKYFKLHLADRLLDPKYSGMKIQQLQEILSDEYMRELLTTELKKAFRP